MFLITDDIIDNLKPIDSETLDKLCTPEIINDFRERTKNAKIIHLHSNKVYKWENNELIEVKKRKAK